MGSYIILFLLAVFFIFFTLIILLSRYKKCPSDRIMVIYGKTKERRAARCIHGGAAFIMPVIQDYGFMSLRPMQIEVNLTNALCKQNIRINAISIYSRNKY